MNTKLCTLSNGESNSLDVSVVPYGVDRHRRFRFTLSNNSVTSEIELTKIQVDELVDSINKKLNSKR